MNIASDLGFEYVYAIIRVDEFVHPPEPGTVTNFGIQCPWAHVIKVKKIVATKDEAEDEVVRLKLERPARSFTIISAPAFIPKGNA